MDARWVISDTNILIDLQKTGLMGVFFTLPNEVHTTDLVIEEIVEPEQKTEILDLVNKGYLVVDSLDPEEMSAVSALIEGNLSIADCSVWYCARKRDWILLTGDKRLRTRAEKDGVCVGGILYVLDRLVEYNTIPKAYAAEKLELLRRINKRLPQEEVDSRLREWTELTNL